jgi:polar amino acid transport system substrate-binding protein
VKVAFNNAAFNSPQKTGPYFVVGHGLAVTASAQTVLHLAAVEDSQISTVGRRILQKILPRASVQVDVTSFTSARATLESRAGRVDGEVARIANFASDYPELIGVDPPYRTFYTVAYGETNKALVLNGPDALKAYKVAIVCGVQHSENAVRGVANVTRVTNVEQLLNMLEAGSLQTLR